MFFGPLVDIDGHNRETLGSGLQKIEKIFSAHNDQGDMNRGKKWFSEKLRNKFCLRKFLVRVILDTSLYRELPLPSSCCKGGLPSEIALQGRTLESEIVYRRVNPDFENRRNIFGS